MEKHFEADFLWKVSLKILNSGIILKTFTHAGFIQTKLNKIQRQIHSFQGLT